MSNYIHKSWQQYEAGKQYKSRIGLYERAKQNEAFYRGEQWQASEGTGLPKPVFNLVKRVVDYLVCSVASSDITVRYTDESAPFLTEEQRELSDAVIDILNKNTAFRWEKSEMDAKLYRVLTDAALCGDGAFYCYWNAGAEVFGEHKGEIVTDLIDGTRIFPADVNVADIQSQEYIIICGRASVASLKAEARALGVGEDSVAKIVSDSDTSSRSGRNAEYELEGDDEAKATFIVKFWRENGRVCFEKSTRECIIKRTATDCTLYPLAYFNWNPTKDSFHGTSPVTSMIPNQKFINRAYAMAMKHMTDTAFSKVIYDKSKIPEWTNEVGEAIAAMGGGNISDAVSVVSSGQMQGGFLDFVESAVTLTKELMGATESALGNLEAKNTSAILALQETSRIALDNIRYALYRCIEQLAHIWADMVCAYYTPERLLPCLEENGVGVASLDTSLLRDCALCAHVDVVEVSRYSAASSQNLLDKLFDGGHISASEYLTRLPTGLIGNREELLEALKKREGKEVENGQ